MPRMSSAQIPRRALLTRTSYTHINSSSASRAFTLSSRRAARPQQPIKLQNPSARRPSANQPPPPPHPSKSTSPKTDSLANLVNDKKWPLFGAGLAALGIGLYISLVITTTLKEKNSPTTTETPLDPTQTPTSTTTTAATPETILPDSAPSSPHLQPPPTGLPSTLDTTTPTTAAQTAQAFDRSLNTPEWLGGITTLRRQLAARARGHVLEVAVGTGRNLSFYDWSEVVSQSQDEAEARTARERERVVRLLNRHRLGGPTLREQKESGSGGLEVGSEEGEVLSYTGLDISGDMLGVARDRIRETVPGLVRLMRKRRLEEMPRWLTVDKVGPEGVEVVDALDGRVRLVLGDAVRGFPAPPHPSPPQTQTPQPPQTKTQTQPEKYDTIIQTFGLCSVTDPTTLLANMASHLQPNTGRILLLEHGRGTFDWMNRRLDTSAPQHFQKYGCWWNRDIERLVAEAAEKVPGLEVVKLERPGWFQMGTTLMIELRVKREK